MTQTTIDWDLPKDGSTYDHERDGQRLSEQGKAVYDLMRDGKWRTLAEIAEATHCPEASVSARLRDLRKPRFGNHTVDRRYLGSGVWAYRVTK